MNKRTLVPIALVALCAATLPTRASAQRLEHDRGNILSIDYDRGTVELRDAKNRVLTRQFRKDASVKFTDGARLFPRPSVHDLRAPMYVHYMFQNDVITSFDVVELGFDPGNPGATGSGGAKQQGVSRTVIGRVSAYDQNVRQVAVEHDGRTEAFQLTDRSDKTFRQGDRVRLRTDWSGQRELVVESSYVDASGRDTATRPNDQNPSDDTRQTDRNRGRRDRGDSSRDRDRSSDRYGDRSDDRYRDRSDDRDRERTSDRGQRDRDYGSDEGRVVRISERGVVIERDGERQTYGVASSRLLRDLRTGDRVRFDWELRDGRPFITDIR